MKNKISVKIHHNTEGSLLKVTAQESAGKMKESLK